MGAALSPATTNPVTRAGWSSLGELTGYQWFVFLVASMAWTLDCMDQQFFTLSRNDAMKTLVVRPTDSDPRIDDYARNKFEPPIDPKEPGNLKKITDKIFASDVDMWAGRSTSAFLIGWALGGLGFGIIGDRYGRVRSLSITILIYSLFTGLSAVSSGVEDFLLYRLLTGIGVGGVFAVVVALIAESMPDRARPFTLGLLQMLSAFGNCAAALVFMYLGHLQEEGVFNSLYIAGLGPVQPWRLMYLIGIVPGLLAVVVQLRLHEPEKWVAAKAGPKKTGSFVELLSHPVWRKHALFGLLLALAGVIGLWCIGFFTPDLQGSVLKKTFTEEAAALGKSDDYINGKVTQWKGITFLMLNIGAFGGMFAFSWLTSFTGRRPAFAVAFLAAAGSTILVFATMKTREDIMWMVPLMGFCQLALFGGYAIYFPELFPTRLRSTGTSFCYNFGRLIAAFAPPLMMMLRTDVFGQYSEPLRWGGVTMCSVFLLGLIALPFLPETKGKPLPEDDAAPAPIAD
jgi:MFS family permease